MNHCPICNAVYNPRWGRCASCGHRVKADTDQNQIIHHMESAVLGRTVKMILDVSKADQVVFDGATYTLDEIRKLKSLDRGHLIQCHNVKTIFEGAIQ